MSEYVGFNIGTIPDFSFADLQIPVTKEFAVSDGNKASAELQQKFGKSDLRTVDAEKRPFPGVDGLVVSYRPQFNDLYISGFTAKEPGRSMLLKLDDQGLPRAGRLIDDPAGSLAEIFKANGLPFLAQQMATVDQC